MFNQYKPIKTIKQGGNSLKVVLLENKKGHKIIMKQYDPTNSEHKESFNREINILTKLKSYKFVPKLIHVDHNNFTFYETYCGSIVPKTYPEYNQKIMERTKDLYEKYGLCYMKNDKQQFMVHWKNYCILDNEIYMIDFGSSRWIGF